MSNTLKEYQKSLLDTFNDFSDFQEFIERVDFDLIFMSLSEHKLSILNVVKELRNGFVNIRKVQEDVLILYFRMLWFLGSFEEILTQNWGNDNIQEYLDHFFEFCQESRELIKNRIYSNLFCTTALKSEELENLICLHNNLDDLNKNLSSMSKKESLFVSSLSDSICLDHKCDDVNIGLDNLNKNFTVKLNGKFAPNFAKNLNSISSTKSLTISVLPGDVSETIKAHIDKMDRILQSKQNLQMNELSKMDPLERKNKMEEVQHKVNEVENMRSNSGFDVPNRL
eukprot:TRINITY_DN3184_c0_g1_i2.p1 TRINITY_DN3184_c0_g1~~TRINITY_DN3184_c0_g1_i2.p1  ORF type:complete len:283 (+),score=58.60 TRINITY_DN3184_c0_g1_i2:53-901(+)